MILWIFSLCILQNPTQNYVLIPPPLLFSRFLLLINFEASDCENTGILTLLWSTYGYFRIVRTCKITYDISGICTPTRYTSHTHTLHVTYTIEQHSLRAYFTRPIYTTRTIFTSVLYARTIYAPTYAHNQCQLITCTIYAPNLRVQSTSYFSAHTLQSMPENYVYNLCA